jgi:hypothetical protein
MKNMATRMVLPVLVFACAAGLFGQEAGTALVRELVGTVEMKAPGKAEWEPVRPGQRLSADTLISTGFKSTVNLVLGDSVLTVRPLTRLSITEISRRDEGDLVDLNLRAGRVRAEVRPPSGRKVDFIIRSPVVTASVRGTVFEIDPLNLQVSEGTVEFFGTSGAAVVVDRGGSSFVEESGGRPVSPAEIVRAALRPELPQGAASAIPLNEITPERGALPEFLPEFSVSLDF